MKKRFFKKVLSFVLAAAMAVSTCCTSFSNISITDADVIETVYAAEAEAEAGSGGSGGSSSGVSSSGVDYTANWTSTISKLLVLSTSLDFLGGESHGTMWQIYLKTSTTDADGDGVKDVDDEGNTITTITKLPAFCISYGSQLKSGASFTASESSGTLTALQEVAVKYLVYCYYYRSGRTKNEYIAYQIIIWWICQTNAINLGKSGIIEAWNGDLDTVTPDSPRSQLGNVLAELFSGSDKMAIINACNTAVNQISTLAGMKAANADAIVGKNFPDGANIMYWTPDNSSYQHLVSIEEPTDSQSSSGGTAEDGGEDTTVIEVYLPYVSEYYIEETVTTSYSVEVVKESVITNELLEGIEFKVVESEADGYDLTYDIYHGTLVGDNITSRDYALGMDYEDEYDPKSEEPASQTETFGVSTTTPDPVPYMDADIAVTPDTWQNDGNGWAGTQHETTMTTDEDGYASVTFWHSHTFKEYYSICYDENNEEITYDEYLEMWTKAIEDTTAAEQGSTQPTTTTVPGHWVYPEEAYKGQDTTPKYQDTYTYTSAGSIPSYTVYYKGETYTDLTYEDIINIYASQFGYEPVFADGVLTSEAPNPETDDNVYTQSQDKAESTINSLTSAYRARTYTYTVTELDNYTREGDTDSNGKELDEITLPKEGYRKDVKDTTTVGSYVGVVANGGTFKAGADSDIDSNTSSSKQGIITSNVTNEPWYNQIFINKTDLESGNQILYDTEFEIYEYYAYKVTLSQAAKKIYPYNIYNQYLSNSSSTVNPEDITAATIVVKLGDTEQSTYEVDVDKMLSDSSYYLEFKTTSSGTFTVELILTVKETVEGTLYDIDSNTQGLKTNVTETLYFLTDASGYYTVDKSGTADGGTIEITETFEGTLSGLCEDPDSEHIHTDGCYEKVTEYRYDDEGNIIKNDDGSLREYYTGDVVLVCTLHEHDSSCYSSSEIVTTITYTDPDGVEHDLSDEKYNTTLDYSTIRKGYYTLTYTVEKDLGIKIIDGVAYDSEGNICTSYTDNGDGTYTLEHEVYNNGQDYTYATTLSVSAAEINTGTKTASNCDPDDYTTWGQANYEIVRVTAEIAQLMGWTDDTIGMYTVHRLSATDQYCGTTFSDTYDWATGGYYGYAEYGTLYYTQANEGKFAIVEVTAPADGDNTGYLGNYEDRDYSYLDDADGTTGYDMQSSTTDQKNYGLSSNSAEDPEDTEDSISYVKYVHYLNLCNDTNQYATYMLVDGYIYYDSTYYTNIDESVTDEDGNEDATHSGSNVDGKNPNEYGYDALTTYDQSSLTETIGLENYTLDGDVIEDVLNSCWDSWMSTNITSLARKYVKVVKDSDKTDTFFSLNSEIAESILHHYVGTTINNNSTSDNVAEDSNIAYDGTYTDTTINYNSYSSEAEALNARHGFNYSYGTLTDDNEKELNGTFLQVGDVTYDDGTLEKEARYYNTTDDVSTDSGYAFIDEREYGYIRFTKYDDDAERYIDDDLVEGLDDAGEYSDAEYSVSGTDHADADLDGAVYSLYVDESNEFEVLYLEGTYNGKLFWAQPLTTGGYRVIWDADDNTANGFTDEGDNEYTDYADAYVINDDTSSLTYSIAEGFTGTFYFDYNNSNSANAAVEAKTTTYYGIQHPDGMYGGAKHNGFFAVLEEQQVFIDVEDEDGFADTWTLQDVTLYAGAKVASAVISDGELYFDGLYLGDYYIAEEIRGVVAIFSTDSDDIETAEVRWLSFAAGYEADCDESGNPTKYYYSFPYTGVTGQYEAEQDYVHKDTDQYSTEVVAKGYIQIHKVTSTESTDTGNTTQEALEGAGFTVYLISELSLIVDGTIEPAYTETEGHRLVEANKLTKLYDESGQFVGYEFTTEALTKLKLYDYFAEKYPDGYNLDDVNRIIYIADRGYYYIEDILDAYRDLYYDQDSNKWDFSNEEQAIARIYEEDESYIEEVNAYYDYRDNSLNDGSSCEWYGPYGLGDGWVATDVKNEYVLSELFTNHYGDIRFPMMSWGAYIVVETTTPTNKESSDPYFFTISDSSPTENRAKSVTLINTSIKVSLVLVKRDAQSGQDVLQSGVKYRIWDYTNNRYVTKYITTSNGEFSMVAQSIFTTDEEGRLNAVADLEFGDYRIEELVAPEGYHNTYWDYGNSTDGELLGGEGEDADVATLDNMFQKYYGTVDFTVTTDRLYKASGITSSGNLDYIYIGETYYNDEIQGKLTIQKTGEVLVGYESTDDIEYADEYTDSSDSDYNSSKSMNKDRSVFESMKDYYDLGTDEVEERTITFDLTVSMITKVKYLAQDRNGMYLAAIWEDDDGQLYTMSGGAVYLTGAYVTTGDDDDDLTFYPGATVEELDDVMMYTTDNGTTWYPANVVTETSGNMSGSGGVALTVKYYDLLGEEITDKTYISTMTEASVITTIDGTSVYVPTDMVTVIEEDDGYMMVVYDEVIDTFEKVTLEEVDDKYIYTVTGDEVNTSYLVTDTDGVLITNDYGVLTKKSGSKYTLTYTEAICDPDTNYDYIITWSDGSTTAVKLVTEGIYLTTDGELVKAMSNGGYSIEAEDGTVTKDPGAEMEMDGDNTGETYDFVYEERRLAGATYVIRAAEDIATQDGGEDNYWFKEGDIVAVVTTANDGEFVSFSPSYNTGGEYDVTYYYGDSGGYYTSYTTTETYDSDEFSTTGSIVNMWIKSRMSDLDQAIYGVPSYTDSTIYPNSFYREGSLKFYRRIIREGKTVDAIITDYQSRLEAENGTSSEGYAVITQSADGFVLTYEETVEYTSAKLTENSDYYILTGTGRSGETIDIEVAESTTLYVITESYVDPWTAGDYVEKTASGYKIVHTDPAEVGTNNGSTVDGASDLGYTTITYYPSATIYDNGDETYTLYDTVNGKEVVTMKSGLLVTEAGGIVTKTGNSTYSITYTVMEEYTDNDYVTPDFYVTGADVTIKDDTYELTWNSAKQVFETVNGTTITFNDDWSEVTVTMDGETATYTAFDVLVYYQFDYAVEEDIVTVVKDGTLGEVSIYLPLGSYTVQEVATPYGFVINDEIQTVNFSYVDQVKEVVFNDEETSIIETENQMNIWISKGLTWFVGGLNTIGEHLNNILGVDFFTWGTYGDAESSYYDDDESFINFFNLRVRSWSNPNTPGTPGDGTIEVSKRDLVTGEELPGATLIITDEEGNEIERWVSTDTPHEVTLEDGTYTLTEITAPDGYEVAEDVTFTIEDGKLVDVEEVIMYDAPTSENGFYISKKDLTDGDELPGAELTLTDKDGKVVETWTSTTTPHYIEDLEDGTYTLTETTAPYGYVVSESITFTVTDGEVEHGAVIMYNKTGIVISKQDITTGEELPGATLIITDEEGNEIERWVSTDEPHVFDLEDGTYTLTEITAPDGYEVAEDITFTVINGELADGDKVIMYDAPESDKIIISKKSVTTGEELPGAELVLKDEDGTVIESWTSTDTPHEVELDDGTYILTETVAPGQYNISNSITFTVKDGEVAGGAVIMYDDYDEDRHEESEENQWNLGVGIYKTDEDTDAKLSGAKFGLYTTNDIYNVDGKLLVEAGTLLATATTDENGFANFAVDIALMSKYQDSTYSDPTLTYSAAITYTYTSWTSVGNEEYLLTVEGADDITLTLDSSTGKYLTDDGQEVTVDMKNKTISYQVAQSIDGNTAMNTGSYYIQEITPPDGYLYDDTIYYVNFEYDDQYTLYIPVYAEHSNEQVKVKLDKYELTGEENVEGATVSVYKINDVNDTNDDGVISHDDDNLTLIDTWVTDGTAHEVEGLLLSNTEWPRLTNQEVRENIYVYREEIAADGYTTAKDIEFKIYQLTGEDGWVDSTTGDTYGYEILVKDVTCDQSYVDGSITVRSVVADADADQEYEELLSYHTTVEWLLVNKTLVITLDEFADEDTINSVLREEDFEDYDIEAVYIDFSALSETFEVDFYTDLQVDERPEDSYLTWTAMWVNIEDLKISMYDDHTKLTISKQDIATCEEIAGAELEIWSVDEDGEKVELIDSWTSGDDGYDEDGVPYPHYIEYIPSGDYMLIETTAPDGYAIADVVYFTVEDDGSVQKVVMFDDTSSFTVNKYQTGTSFPVAGAKINIYKVPEEYISYLVDGADISVDAGLVTDEDLAENGLTENTATIASNDLASYLIGAIAANGAEYDEDDEGFAAYVTLYFSITASDMAKYGTSFTMEMPDTVAIGGTLGSTYTVKAPSGDTAFAYKATESNGKYYLTVTFDDDYVANGYSIYNISMSIPMIISADAETEDGDLVIKFSDTITLTILNENITPGTINTETVNIVLTEDDLVYSFVSSDTSRRVRGLEVDTWYIALEVSAPDGYILDSTPQVFFLFDTTTEQELTFYNSTSGGDGGGTVNVETPETPEAEDGILELAIDSSWYWNNYKTGDNGEKGYSITFTIDTGETAAETTAFPFAVLAIAVVLMAGGCAVILVATKRKKKGKFDL